MKKGISLLLVILLCLSICSCDSRTGKNAVKNQNEMSEFLAGKQIMAFLNDGSILCYSSSRTETVPGRTENTYYRYYPDDDTSVLIEESGAIDNLFSVNDIKTGEYDNLYFMGWMKDEGGYGCVKFDVTTGSFVTAGEDEKINSDYITAKSIVTDFDVNYTDGEKYYYIIDESEQKSYFYTYDKDGNMLRELKLPAEFNDVRDEYGTFTKMMVLGEYLYLEITGVSYSAVLKISDSALRTISKGFDGRIALGYDPLCGADPVMYKNFSEENECRIIDIETGKNDKFEIEITDGKGKYVSAVWQNSDSVLICVSEDLDKSGHGFAYYIVPTEELPFTTLGDENTLYFQHDPR